MSRAKEKAATTDYRALDIRRLNRAGVLVPNWGGNWQWSRHGEVCASIEITTESLTRLRLRYQSTRHGKTESKDYPILINWTPCHLGGNRPWFLCPCCSRRVAKLYSGTYFACRHCLRLNYASQQASKRDRAADRSWVIRQTLGCDDGFLGLPAEFIAKPKGMHWRTFRRRIDQLKRVDARAFADAGALIASIDRKLLRV